MPRLKQTEEQKQNIYLVANIKRGMDVWGISKEQLAKRTDISLATLYNRLNAPETFHLYELYCRDLCMCTNKVNKNSPAC